MIVCKLHNFIFVYSPSFISIQSIKVLILLYSLSRGALLFIIAITYNKVTYYHYLPTGVPTNFQCLGTATSDRRPWWTGPAVWVPPVWRAWTRNWTQRTVRTRRRWRSTTKSCWWTTAWWRSKCRSPPGRWRTPLSRSSKGNHRPSPVRSETDPRAWCIILLYNNFHVIIRIL